MPKLRRAAACAVVLIASAASSSSRAAAGFPPDPASNTSSDPSCSAPASCLSDAITLLDRARARSGQPAYRLPSSFSALRPAEQVFVLTNLDRVLYGLRPITGLTADLDAAADAGVRLDHDPMTDAPDLVGVASNWASGYGDMPLAYEAWMYADGPGADNVDCATPSGSACWGHRHNILWPFAGTGPLAMGAAAGVGSGGASGYTLLLAQGSSEYRPAYLYTWSQALAAGAGSGASSAPSPQRRVAGTVGSPIRITLLWVRSRSLHLRVQAPRSLRLSCVLTRLSASRLQDRYVRCSAATTYRRLRRGRYRLRVRGGGRTLTRYVVVR